MVMMGIIMQIVKTFLFIQLQSIVILSIPNFKSS